MAKYLVLSVGLVKENYSKDEVLKYLKDEVSKVAFKKLIIFASEKTIQSGLNEFFDYLKEIKVEFTVFPGEDEENIGYLKKVSNAASNFTDENDSIIFLVEYISGFLVIEEVIAPTKEEEEMFNHDKDKR